MKPSRFPAYGGQALMEGVLMRGKKHVAAAFRAPDGSIIVRDEPLQGIYRTPIFSMPFVRGLIGLWDAIGLGTRYLGISANIQSPEETIDDKSMLATMIVSFAIGIAIFFALPALAGHWIESSQGVNSFLSNLAEGLIRLVLILLYMWGIGRMPEIARVFAYHGAEHKTINAFEGGSEMSVEKVMAYPIEHPRCGTAFLLVLVVFSILFFSLLGPMSGLARVLTRIIFLPLLAGLAYEYLRFTANHIDNRFIRWIAAPNLALQHLTTREPEPSMVEVAVTAFNRMKFLEEQSG